MATIKARVGTQNTVRVLTSSATAATRIIDSSDLNSTLKTEDGMILVWDTGSSAFIMTSVIDSASTTIEGIAFFTNTTESTLPTNGALVVSCGVGVGKHLNVGAGVSVVGIATFASNVDINAAVDILNGLNVGGATTLASQGGITTTGGNLFVGGNFEVAGTSNFIGNATFRGGTIGIGDSTSDDINVGGEFTSNLVPNADNAFDLGITTQRWRDAKFSGLVTTTNLFVSGVSTFTGDVDLSGDLSLTGDTSIVGFLSVTEGLFYDDDFSAETGVAYFNTSGKLVSSASTIAAISTSEYILTTQVTSGIGTPVWTDTIDGGTF
jgi:hypothetical protein